MNTTVKPVRKFTADEIRTIREELGFNRTVFAAILGVSRRTVESWEAGINTPAGSSARLISIMKDDSGFAEKYKLVVKGVG